MTNRKAVREQLLKQAGATKLPNGKWKLQAELDNFRESVLDALDYAIQPPNVCFTCKSCWRRSLQSDLNRLQCPFCGGNMTEGGKP